MPRKYRLKRRAEKQEATRRRIVEAVVELHETVGPAQTTISAVAERAGVQRVTVYRHFPDEASLYRACAAHWRAEHPLPDPEAWSTITDPRERLRRALIELAAYYEHNEQMLANVQRDAPFIPALLEALGSVSEALAHMHQVLSEGWEIDPEREPLLRGALAHALAFTTWRSLVREQGIPPDQAADLLVCLVDCARHGGGRQADSRIQEPGLRMDLDADRKPGP